MALRAIACQCLSAGSVDLLAQLRQPELGGEVEIDSGNEFDLLLARRRHFDDVERREQRVEARHPKRRGFGRAALP